MDPIKFRQKIRARDRAIMGSERVFSEDTWPRVFKWMRCEEVFGEPKPVTGYVADVCSVRCYSVKGEGSDPTQLSAVPLVLVSIEGDEDDRFALVFQSDIEQVEG